jgi:TonB-dependent receptor
MKKIFLFAVINFCIGSVMAQTGTINGNLFKTELGEKVPLAMAKMIELEDGKFVRTDFDGNFNMELSPGVHHVVVKYAGIHDTLEMDIVEGENPEFVRDMSMSNTLKMVVVNGKLDNGGGSEVKAAKDTKDDDKVVTVQTATQMEQKGAGDVADATKKITGLSTVGSVLYVRGLGDRYNVAYLNGLPLPSPDPDFRVVPLDLFPTDIVNSVQVSKVMSSELYGDFAGGAFNIITKSFYNEPTMKISLSTGGNTQTTFQKFKTYNGGKFDFFGFDDGTRSIPAGVFDNSKDLTTFPGVNSIFPDKLYNTNPDIGSAFENNFGVIEKTSRPNTSFSISAGTFKPFAKSKDKSSGYGILAMVKNDNSLKYQEGVVKIINAQSEERLNYDVKQYNYETSTTGLLNFYVRINPNHNISVNSLFVNKSNDETRETWGYHFDYDPFNVYSRRLTYKQNFLNVNQVVGTHKFFNHKEDKNFSKLIVDWRASMSFTGSKEPDRRQLVALYTGDEEATDSYDMWNALDVNENHRFFSILQEREMAAKVNFAYVIKSRETETSRKQIRIEDLITLRGGVDYKNKTRAFDYKQYNYNIKVLADNNQPIDIYNTDYYLSNENHQAGLFFIDELSNFGSSYVAEQSVLAAYVDAKFRLNKLEVIPGVRVEHANQSVLNRDQVTPSQFNHTVVPNDIAEGILPSLILKYSHSEKDVFRFVASKTLTRPKFNEIAPFQYIQFFAGTKAQGNDSLKNGTNYNADFRYERYPRAGEMITIGGFYKYLQNPIEQTMRGTASGQLASFSNAKQGHVAGVEFEYVRSLSFLVKEEKRDSSILKDFGLGFNAAYMWTQVTIDTLDLGNNSTNYIRPLEGASPFLVNLDLRYQKSFKNEDGNKKDVLVSLAYNLFGQRLVAVGGNGIGDQYATPVSTLNLVTKMTFNDKFSIGLKGKNLLNPYINVIQEDMQVAGNKLNVSSFRRGMDISLSLAYTITKKANKKPMVY